MVSAKTLLGAAAAFTTPLFVSAASNSTFNTTFNSTSNSTLNNTSNGSFNSALPFVLHTEVNKGNASFNGFYLTPFHVGAGQQTIVATRNASIAIGFVLNGTALEQPISNTRAYQYTLLEQEPYLSDAPAGYDLIGLGITGRSSGFFFDNSSSLQTNNTDFNGWALCHVNGTAPYFTLGPQYQLFWKSTEQSCYDDCADVDLVASNPASFSK